MGGAPAGNKNAIKLGTSELKKKAYDSYCAWLAKGKSSRSFTFVEGDLMCTGQTIEAYMKEYPIEFPAVKRQVANSQGYAVWEGVVEESASGQNKEANTASLQMLMRNKFGWDKPEVNTEEALANLEKMKEFFKTIS